MIRWAWKLTKWRSGDPLCIVMIPRFGIAVISWLWWLWKPLPFLVFVFFLKTQWLHVFWQPFLPVLSRMVCLGAHPYICFGQWSTAAWRKRLVFRADGNNFWRVKEIGKLCCWKKKSVETKQLRLVVYPTIYNVLYIANGGDLSGFLPSMVCHHDLADFR